MLDTVCSCRLQRAGDQMPIGGSDVDRPRLVKELRSYGGLELTPVVVGAMQERNVVGMLVVRESYEPRVATAGAQLVRNAEPLESEHPGTTSRQMKASGRAHCAHTCDDDVETPVVAHLALDFPRGVLHSREPVVRVEGLIVE